MQPYPGSPDLIWPGQLQGTGCLSARAVGTRFPTVVRCLCLSPGCGWEWVLLTPPVLVGVLGGCVWARFVVLSLFCQLFVVFLVGLRFRHAYGTCVVACALRLPLCGFWFRCAVWACVLGPGLGCALPFLAGLSGCVFCAFFFLGLALWCRLLGVPVPGLVAPVLHPLSFGLGCWLFFFFHGVCLHVSVSLFPVGRCCWLGVAVFCWVVPLCLFGGPVFGAFWVGGLAASCGVGGRFGVCSLFTRTQPLPPLFFFGGGRLPVPPLAFPWLAHALACIQCGLPGCCWRLRSVWPCSGPMSQVGYVHVGLGAPSCRAGS